MVEAQPAIIFNPIDVTEKNINKIREVELVDADV